MYLFFYSHGQLETEENVDLLPCTAGDTKKVTLLCYMHVYTWADFTVFSQDVTTRRINQETSRWHCVLQGWANTRENFPPPSPYS